MTTKQQERDALAKIEKILKSLDADGYVNTAFAGCVEDARRNIDEDAAYSAADNASRWMDVADKLTGEKVALEKEIENLRRRTLEKFDIATAALLASKRLSSLEEQIKENERTILATCTTPESDKFCVAVAEREQAIKERDNLTSYRKKLGEILGA